MAQYCVYGVLHIIYIHTCYVLVADLFAINFSIQTGQSGDKQFDDPSTVSPWMRWKCIVPAAGIDFMICTASECVFPTKLTSFNASKMSPLYGSKDKTVNMSDNNTPSCDNNINNTL